MTCVRTRAAGICVAVLIAWGPHQAYAQVSTGQNPPAVTPPAGSEQPPQEPPATLGQRTYRGLFGGTSIGPGQPGLSLQFGGYGGYDDDLIAAQSGQSQSGGPAIGGRYEGGNAGLAYLHMSPKLTMSAATLSDMRHYDRLGRNTYSHSGDLAADFAIGTRTHLVATERAEIASLFRFGALPGLDPDGTQPSAADYQLTDRDRVSSDSTIQYTRELSSRSTLIGNAGYRVADSQGTVYDLRVVTAGAAYQRQYTRYTNLRVGYIYSESRYGGALGRKVVVNGVDLGGGYVRPLSFSRRTTVSFTGGVNVLTQENPGVDPVRFVRAIGTFGVQHEIGRTWTLNGEYNRGVQFVELFPDPFFVDTASASVAGMLTRHLELTTRAAFADGQMRFNATPGQNYRSYSSSTDLIYAFNAMWAVTATYAYYKYDFGARAGLPPGLAPAVERQSVRFGLRVWVPVFGAR